jgi:beta-glucosidase
MYRALDHGVTMWATLNEPWVVTDGGYLHGKLAPGHRDLYETPIAARNLMLAHAAAVKSKRSEGRPAYGVFVNNDPMYSASRRREDHAATARADAYMNRQYLDPIRLGRSPREMREVFGDAWPGFGKADLAAVRQPVDFVGVNYYQRSVVENDPTALPVRASGVPQPGSTHTETGWEVYPRGLTDTLLWLRKRYGNRPFYVTENGAAFYDPPSANGGVDDPLRVRYLTDHLRAARDAIRQGVDLRGYFAWSFLDNFEWSHGFSKRFGIVHVDYATQKRTPKASARFYAEVIQTNGAALEEAGGGRASARPRVPAPRGSRARPKRPKPRGR